MRVNKVEHPSKKKIYHIKNHFAKQEKEHIFATKRQMLNLAERLQITKQ